MRIRQIIKNILPHYFVNKFQNGNGLQVASNEKYLEIGDSILQSNFQIKVLRPEERKYVFIGNDNLLDCHILFESGKGKVTIGNKVYIGHSTIICRTGIEFGNNIFVAWGAYFYDHDSHSTDYRLRQEDLEQQLRDQRAGHSFIKNKNWDVVKTASIRVCDNAWIGMNAIILKGVTIGEGSIVAAGSVVSKDVDPWTIVAGNPAQFVRQIEH